jgi:hypothetical protein
VTSPRPLAALALSVLALASCRDARGERIVLVTVDTWRADALTDMPRTAALLRRGLSFEQAYSATSTTQPTHASLLTGLHPWQHGVTRNGEVLGEEVTTVAERLASAGWSTGAVAASFPVGRRFGFAQGFQHYTDDFDEVYVQNWEGEAIEGGRFFSLGPSIARAARATAAALEGDRQFLWIHLFDPHDPYGDADAERAREAIPILALLAVAGQGPEAQARALLERAQGLYRRDLAALDGPLADLLEELSADGRFATHLVVTGDHGESFGEQGCIGHGKRLTPEQVHVPLAIVSPRVTAGTRRDAAGSVDVAATLLALAGADRSGTHGRDLLGPVPPAAHAYGMRRNFTERKSEQLVDGRQLPVEGSRFFVAGGGELLTGDAEHVLIDDDPTRPFEGPRAGDLKAAFAGFGALLEGTSVELLESDEVNQALKALGYGGE